MLFYKEMKNTNVSFTASYGGSTFPQPSVHGREMTDVQYLFSSTDSKWKKFNSCLNDTVLIKSWLSVPTRPRVININRKFNELDILKLGRRDHMQN